jgi:hypothetical protein
VEFERINTNLNSLLHPFNNTEPNEPENQHGQDADKSFFTGRSARSTCPQVLDTSEQAEQQTDSNKPKQTNLKSITHSTEKPTYSQGAIQERKSLLKTWMASVIGTAIAFALVSGIKDLRALITTSMSAGSIAFVVSALANSSGHK